MEQENIISQLVEQNKLLVDMMCHMQKQLDEVVEMKSLFQQFLNTSTGIKEVTKSAIMSIITDAGKRKLSTIDPKQVEIAQIRERRASESIKKVAKKAQNSTIPAP